MPRSLSQAGVNTVPFWVKVEHIDNQPFYVASATERHNRFGNQEAVLKLRLRDGVYDEDGELHKLVFLSLTISGEGQRRDIVKYFQSNNDPLGPCIFTSMPTGQGNPFYRIDDATPEMIAMMSSEPRKVLPSESSGQMGLEDIPF